MKYSILGFSQEEVLKCKTTIDVNGKEKEVCIDVTDLLILQCVADFMNRQHIYKYMINDKMYFSIQYKALLEDLPILNIGKQALRDRIDKLVSFNLLEKEVVKNEQGTFVVFRIGSRYEQLMYKNNGAVCGEILGGVYQTTHGCVSNYTPKNSTTINSSTIKEKEDKSSKKNELKLSDYIEIHNKWEELNPQLPSIRCFNEKRKKALKTLLKNNNATIDDLYKVFEIISVCSFCQGNNDRKWTATLDWVLNDTKSCFNRLLEGAYAFSESEKQKVQQIVNNEQLITQQASEQVIIGGQIYR